MHEKHMHDHASSVGANDILRVSVLDNLLQWDMVTLPEDGETVEETVNPNANISDMVVTWDLLSLQIVPSGVPKVDDDNWRCSSLFKTSVTSRGQACLFYIDSGSAVNEV